MMRSMLAQGYKFGLRHPLLVAKNVSKTLERGHFGEPSRDWRLLFQSFKKAFPFANKADKGKFTKKGIYDFQVGAAAGAASYAAIPATMALKEFREAKILREKYGSANLHVLGLAAERIRQTV